MKAIVGGRVITITHGVLERGVVLTEGGKIVGVGADLHVPADAEVIDAAGQVVMPGLIDAHAHTGLFGDAVGPQEVDGNEMTDPITPHLRAIDSLNPDDIAWPELVEAGVTTIFTGPGSGNLIGGQSVVVKTVGRTVDEMVLLNPAGMKMALGENPKRVYGEMQHKAPSTRMGNAAAMREAFVQAQEYDAKWHRYQARVAAGGEEAAKAEPPARDLRLEALAKVLRREMRARIHCHRADDILTAVRIAEEFGLDYALEHVTEGYKVADVLARKGVPCVVGPILFSRSKQELKGLSPKNAGLLSRAGVKVAIQTDEMSAVKYLAINAALAVREGMPEEDALRAITIHPAEIIGVADRVGSLDVGKDADVVVFSGHPFEYRTVANWVLIDGNVVFRRVS
jgi:imidazolonepropionase-like amidohydrolase